ncbi:IS3 family transposase [Streptomyces sp. NPDC001455]|uniref:IS3 family transposase n=1 Tax=Streptomyces sp. NPDC001455 TaxID=3154518 RepID=UPI0033270D31
MNRQGHAVARCTVERLMRELGIQGAVRGKRVITTIPGGQAERAPIWSTATSPPPRTGAGWRTSPT